jgi:putative membrane protein
MVMFQFSLLLLIEDETWESAGHAVSFAWVEYAGALGASVLLLGLLFLIARGLTRRSRYCAVDRLSPTDLEAIREEIVAAEKRTVGEIVPVIVERSDRHPAASWLSALAFALLGSTVLTYWFAWHNPTMILLAQIICGGLGYLLATRLPGFKRAFVRESRATEMAEEQAFQEFYRHGLHRTDEQTGVLLFVSLLEHRVVVLADEGIDGKVGASQWEETDRAILEGICAGSLREGIIAGIRSAADVLEEHFPWREGDRNEIPDRVIVRKE